MAARRLPGPGAPGAGAHRRRPRAVAGGAADHDRLHRPDARRAVAAGRAGGRAAADLRRRGVPARAGRAGRRRGPRGVEHLRADRGHRRRLRRAADRRGAGADRAAARRLGARRRRRRGRAGRDGRERRAGDRRGRARPLPRRRARTPRSSPRCPRWAGSAPTAAATSSAPTRPGCCSWGAPTSRSSSAGGASSWARSTPRCSRCPACAARRLPCAAPGPATRCWWGTSCPTATRGLDTDAAALALREQLPAALVPLLAVVDGLPTRTSGKVDRDALPWPLPASGARPRRGGPAHPDRGLAGRGLGGDPRRGGVRPEGRLLHPRRRQPDRRAAGGADPHPAPAGVGQRRLPAPDAGGARDPAGRAGRDQDRASRRGADAAPRRARAGPAHGPDAGAGRPALVERRRGDLDGRRRRRSVGHPWMPDSAVVVARPGLAGVVQPGRADRDRRGRRPPPAARRAARQLPARRLGARAAVGGDPARRAVRCDGRLERVVDHPLRPRARREDRQRRRPALRTARDGPAQDRARRGRGAGGGPRRLLGRRRRRAHRQDPDRRRGHDRLAQHAAAGRADRQGFSRSRPGPRSPARSPPVSTGRARPRGGQASPACRGRRPARCARAPGSSPTASRRCSSGCCPRWRRCLRSRSSRSASQARRPPRRRRAGRC